MPDVIDVAGLEGVDMESASELRSKLQCAPGAPVIATILTEGLLLTETQVASALGCSESAVRSWKSGGPATGSNWRRLQDLGSLSEYLLSFRCFLKPAAAGRWITMPRTPRDRTPAGKAPVVVTALEQIRKDNLSAAIEDAFNMLSGHATAAGALPADTRKAPQPV